MTHHHYNEASLHEYFPHNLKDGAVLIPIPYRELTVTRIPSSPNEQNNKNQPKTPANDDSHSAKRRHKSRDAKKSAGVCNIEKHRTVSGRATLLTPTTASRLYGADRNNKLKPSSILNGDTSFPSFTSQNSIDSDASAFDELSLSSSYSFTSNQTLEDTLTHSFTKGNSVETSPSYVSNHQNFSYPDVFETTGESSNTLENLNDLMLDMHKPSHDDNLLDLESYKNGQLAFLTGEGDSSAVTSSVGDEADSVSSLSCSSMSLDQDGLILSQSTNRHVVEETGLREDCQNEECAKRVKELKQSLKLSEADTAILVTAKQQLQLDYHEVVESNKNLALLLKNSQDEVAKGEKSLRLIKKEFENKMEMNSTALSSMDEYVTKLKEQLTETQSLLEQTQLDRDQKKNQLSEEKRKLDSYQIHNDSLQLELNEMYGRNSKLESLVDQSSSDNDGQRDFVAAIRKERDDLAKRLREKDSQYVEKDIAIKSLEERLSAVNSSHQQLQTETNALKHSTKEQSFVIDQLRCELSTKSAEKLTLDGAVLKLHADLHRVETVFTKIKNEIAEKTKFANKETSLKRQIEEKAKKLKTENESLKRDLETHQQRISDKNHQIAELLKKSARTTDAQVVTKQDIEQLKTQLKSKDDEIAKLNHLNVAQVSRARAKAARISSDHGKQLKEIKALQEGAKNDAITLQGELEKAILTSQEKENELSKVRADFARISSKLEEMTTFLNHRDVEIFELRKQQHKIMEEKNKFMLQVDEMQKASIVQKKDEDDPQEVMQMLAELQTSRRNLSSDLEKTRIAHDQMKEDLSQEIRKLNEDLMSKDERIEHLEETESSLQAKLAKKDQLYSAHLEEVHRLSEVDKEIISQLKQEILQLKESNEDAATDLDLLKQKLQDKLNEILHLQSRHAIAMEELSTAKQEMNSANLQLVTMQQEKDKSFQNQEEIRVNLEQVSLERDKLREAVTQQTRYVTSLQMHYQQWAAEASAKLKQAQDMMRKPASSDNSSQTSFDESPLPTTPCSPYIKQLQNKDAFSQTDYDEKPISSTPVKSGFYCVSCNELGIPSSEKQVVVKKSLTFKEDPLSLPLLKDEKVSKSCQTCLIELKDKGTLTKIVQTTNTSFQTGGVVSSPISTQTDFQPQNPSTSPISTQTDFKPQNPSTSPMSTQTDFKPQIPSTSPISTQTDFKPQTPSTSPISTQNDFKPPTPSTSPISTQTDFQPQNPSTSPISTQTDFQPQNPSTSPISTQTDFQPQNPSTSPISTQTDFKSQNPSTSPISTQTDFKSQTPSTSPISTQTDFKPQNPSTSPMSTQTDFKPQIPSTSPISTQTDFQPQNPSTSPISTQTDFQPQNPSTSPMSTQTDYKPQIPSTSPMSTQTDFKPQIPSTSPISTQNDFKPPTPSTSPISTQTDFQPQNPSTSPISTQTDLKPQNPSTSPISTQTDFKPQNPSTSPISTQTDFKPQIPSTSPISTQTDFKPQNPSTSPISTQTDLKPQNPSTSPISTQTDFKPQIPSTSPISTQTDLKPQTHSTCTQTDNIPLILASQPENIFPKHSVSSQTIQPAVLRTLNSSVQTEKLSRSATIKTQTENEIEFASPFHTEKHSATIPTQTISLNISSEKCVKSLQDSAFQTDGISRLEKSTQSCSQVKSEISTQTESINELNTIAVDGKPRTDSTSTLCSVCRHAISHKSSAEAIKGANTSQIATQTDEVLPPLPNPTQVAGLLRTNDSAKLKAYKQTVKVLKHKLKAAEEKSAESTKQIASLMKEIGELKEKSDAAASKTEGCDIKPTPHQRLYEEMKQWKDSAENKEQENIALQIHINEMRRLHGLEVEKMRTNRIMESDRRMDEATGRLGALVDANERLRRNVGKLQEKLAACTQQLEAAKKDKLRYQERSRRLQSSLRSLSWLSSFNHKRKEKLSVAGDAPPLQSVPKTRPLPSTVTEIDEILKNLRKEISVLGKQLTDHSSAVDQSNATWRELRGMSASTADEYIEKHSNQ